MHHPLQILAKIRDIRLFLIEISIVLADLITAFLAPDLGRHWFTAVERILIRLIGQILALIGTGSVRNSPAPGVILRDFSPEEPA